MTMKADFLDAHERHWNDAEFLFKNERWANADHLFGLAAECGLKRLMLCFGMPYNDQGDKPKERDDRVHADGIWKRYEAYHDGKSSPDYALSTLNNPFADWNIAQRYAPQSAFDRTHVQKHRAGAKQVRELVRQARREGWIC